MANKKKLATAAVALGTAAAVLLGGTFAWQSINQTALNEASDVVNPGGRLHNDMWYVSAKENNNDIYVENFSDPDNGGEDIFARVRLSEYMEVVLNKGTAGEIERQLIGEKTIDEETGETTYTYELFNNYASLIDGDLAAGVVPVPEGEEADPDTEGAPGYSYWTWQTGGETVFMPTFNKNKDSVAPELHGLYVDRVGGISNRAPEQYELADSTAFAEDYEGYQEGDQLTRYAIYDIDSNKADEIGTDPVEIYDIVMNGEDSDYYNDQAIEVVSEEHTAKATGSAQLISMTDWLSMVEEDGGYDPDLHGGYWVYDTDGWVYWSAPISAGEATGLLLNGITLNQVMDDTWYYAIEAVGQFVTADDAGKADGTGFYAEDEMPSSDAETLLTIIGVTLDGESEDGEDDWNPTSMIDLWHDNSDTVKGGELLIFEAVVYDENGDAIAYTEDVTFSVLEVTASGAATMGLFDETIMDGNAVLVAEDILDRGVTEIVVTATYTDGESGTEYSGSYTLNAEGSESPLSIGLSVDGVDISFYSADERVYQMFYANPADHTFTFSATLNDAAATNAVWSLGADDQYTVGEEDGICYAYATGTWDDEWIMVDEGTKVAQIDPATGEFKFLLTDAFPRTMVIMIEVSDEDSGYTSDCNLLVGRDAAIFTMYNNELDPGNIDSHYATYTMGEDSTITLGFTLRLNDEAAEININNLQNWSLRAGSSPDAPEIDSTKYSVEYDTTAQTATLTIPADSGIEAEKLYLSVEYNHGVKAPRSPEGVSSGVLYITESSVTVEDDEVTEFIITECSTGEESAIYTPDTYQKIYLTATPYTAAGDEVYSGSVVWALEGDYENVKLVSDGFNAEIWFLKAEVETVIVNASYTKEGESGIHKNDDFVISRDAETLENYSMLYPNVATASSDSRTWSSSDGYFKVTDTTDAVVEASTLTYSVEGNTDAGTTFSYSADTGDVTLTIGENETATKITIKATDGKGIVTGTVSVKYIGKLQVGQFTLQRLYASNQDIALTSSENRTMTYPLAYYDYWGNLDTSVSFELNRLENNKADTAISDSTLTLAAGENSTIIINIYDSDGEVICQYITSAAVDSTPPSLGTMDYNASFEGDMFTHSVDVSDLSKGDYGTEYGDTLKIEVYKLTSETTDPADYLEANRIILTQKKLSAVPDRISAITNVTVENGVVTALRVFFNYTAAETDGTTYLGVVVTDRAGNTAYAVYPVAES